MYGLFGINYLNMAWRITYINICINNYCRLIKQLNYRPLKLVLIKPPRSFAVFFITKSFQPVFHDWCSKGRGMCYPVCGMMHIK